MTEKIDFESVNISSWQTRIPSEICINRDVFNEIFSLETWNKVLMPDQRERILNMLPPEVIQTVGASQQTIQDLLARTLVRFGTNPLDSFFEQLQQGRFDPSIVQTRKAVQKTWRKEAVRKRKKYHSKLMQEVIVSRENHLKPRLEFFLGGGNNCPPSTLFSDIYSFEEPSLPSPTVSSPFSCTTVYTTKSQSPVKKLNCLESQVEKRYREELSLINHQAGCLTSSDDDESPPKKSAKMTRKAPLTKTVKAKSGKVRGIPSKLLRMLDSATVEVSSSPLVHSATSNNSITKSLLSQQQILSTKSATISATVVLTSAPLTTAAASSNLSRGNSHRAEQTAAQMAKFPKILPAPLTTKLTTTSQNAIAVTQIQPPPQSPSSTTTLLNSVLSSPTQTGLQNMNQLTLTDTIKVKSSLTPSNIVVNTPEATSIGSGTLAVALSSPTTSVNLTPSSNIASSPSSIMATLNTVQFHANVSSSNPTKSSPILASQLQAPTPLLHTTKLSTTTTTNTDSDDHHRLNISTLNFPHQSSLQKDSFNFPSIQNIKRHEDEMESSSDDEFESIEPTIHLFSTSPTVVTPTGTSSSSSSVVKLPQKTHLTNSTTIKASTSNNNLINSSSSPSSLTSEPILTLNKSLSDDTSNLINTKNLMSVTTSTPNMINTSNIPTFTTTTKYTTVQLNKILQSQPSHHQLQQGQSAATTTTTIQLQQQQTPPQQQKVNVVKVITQSPANTFVSKTYSPKVSVIGGTTNVVNIVSTGGSNPIISSGGSTTATSIVPSSSLQPNIVVQTTTQTNNSQTPKPSLTTVPSAQHKIIPIIQQSPVTTTTSVLTTTAAATIGSGRSIITFQAVGGPSTTTSLTNNAVSGTLTLNGPTTTTFRGGLTSGLKSSSTIISTPPPASSSANRVSTVTTLATTTSSSSVADYQMFNLLSQPNVNVIDALGPDDLNLNLTMNHLDDEGIGDDVVDFVDGSKYSKIPDMEKIVDLSVLDGNPFDSIPNLSDELDVLDLDLVEGLCDFDGLLSEEKQYASFFSLIRDVLCSTRDHRMTIQVLEKTIRKWSLTPTAALNMWFLRVHDWNEALMTALNFLAGNYQEAHPEDFVPYIEYKYKTKYYQWIGAGRDSDCNLTTLCQMWLENVDRLPPLKKLEAENDDQEEEEDENEDSDGAGEEAKKKSKRPQTPPPPRCLTDWSVRPSTQEEKEDFQTQERNRFESPHKAFTYQMHGYESVVGPVKGVYSSQSGMTNKARGHSLLVDDRPPYVTILALVRDAVARLPNGEGTRSEICEMLRDSAFLAAEASNVTLNSVVSGALDRLHYERDPCVRYDSHKKSWVYLHRDRTQEQFERLHHNRSYTKSTKSRSNSARKNRKQSTKSQSQSSSPGSSWGATNVATTETSATTKDTIVVTTTMGTTTTTPAVVNTITATTSSPVVVVTTSPSLMEVAKPTVVSSVVTSAATTTTTPTSSFKQIMNVDNSQIVSSSTTTGPRPNIKKISPNEVQATVTSLGGPTIRFTAVPNSTAVNGNLNSTFVTPTQTNSTTANLLSSPHQSVAVQVQSVSTSGSGLVGSIPGSTATVKGPVVSQGGTITNATVNPGQLILHPSALIRLANTLRLPEGVRFAQVKFPTQQAAPQANPMRLPQQRIILTRAAISGQTQTQGVLLGQTPSGQTIILSTGGLSHLGGATTSQINLTSQGSSTIDSSSMTFRSHTISSTTSAIPVSQNASTGPIAVNTNVSRPSAGTISIMTSNSHHPGNIVVTTGNMLNNQHLSATTTPTTTLVVNNSNLTASGTSTTTMLPTASNVMQTVGSNQHLVTSQPQQQSSHVAASPQQQNNSSPIIIRSQHGDLVIPSHIALGRGLPAFKVIPVQAGGKQTVLARLVSQNTPNASSEPP